MSNTQNDARSRAPRGIWHLLLHRRMPPTWQERIVHWGLGTSAVFMILIFADVFIPSVLWPYRYWIGIVYLAFQLAEIVARDPLGMSEAMEDNILSVLPAILALVLSVLHLWSTNGIFTPEGIQTLNCWHAIAWLDFIFGLAISLRILGAPYRRSETKLPPS